MPIGKFSDFKVYDPQIRGGFTETLVQNTAAFNAASRGAIRLRTNRKQGHYEYESFFKNVAGGLISRRDITSTATVQDKLISQDEFIRVKLNRKIGPVAHTLDSWKKAGYDANENSINFTVGQQVASEAVIDQLNTSLSAVTSAIRGVTVGGPKQRGLNYQIPAQGLLDTASLVEGLSNFGDSADRIVAWVMHSKPYYDLVKGQIAANITGVSNFNVASATPVTLNRPVLVTDSDSLRIMGTGSPGPDDFLTLGLTVDSVVAEDTEEEQIFNQLVTGLENIAYRLQGEYAFSLGCKGYKWDVANGGQNPTNAAVATSTNWDAVMASTKDLAGVCVRSR